MAIRALVPTLVVNCTRFVLRFGPGAAAAAITVAIAVDELLGEPPARLHPVVLIGTVASVAERRAPTGARRQLVYGGVLALGLPLIAAGVAHATERRLARLPLILRIALTGIALKPAFAVRGLLQAGRTVEQPLAAEELEAARRAVGQLVSRPVDDLSEELVAAAAIESLAENLTDSVTAPLLAFAVAGLPGAYAYRAVNTLDSMIGYRGRYEWLGKASARLDDALNLVPARLAALALVLAAPVSGGSAGGAVRAVLRDRRVTESPNAGWTMAAAAGALSVKLEKAGHYVLNAGARPPESGDISRARSLVRNAVLLSTGAAMTLAWGLRRR